MNAEQLNAIKERAAKATPGPWGWTYEGVDNVVIIQRGTNEIIARLDDETCDKDLYYIANAREDVPALVAEVERLQQQLEKANGLLGWAHDVLDDVHCYETDVYQEISEYFGEDD